MLLNNQRRYAFKFYGDLQVEMGTMPQPMVEVNKNECANAHKKVKRLYKGCHMQLACSKVLWLKGERSHEIF